MESIYINLSIISTWKLTYAYSRVLVKGNIEAVIWGRVGTNVLSNGLKGKGLNTGF